MSYSDSENAANFKFEVLDSSDNVLNDVCENIYYCSNDTIGKSYHVINVWDSDEIVLAKDWSTIAIDLSKYSNRVIKFRLTTKDSNAGSHYAYVYYTMRCIDNIIVGESCQNIYAPDDFNYQWIKTATRDVVSTNQSFNVSHSDRNQYVCRCSNRSNPSCYFDMNVDIEYFVPEPSFNYELSYSNCMTQVSFSNTSSVYTINNGQKQYLTQQNISHQRWSVESRHHDWGYHLRSSENKNLDTIFVYSLGDTLDVTLTVWYDDCEADTTISIYVPPLFDYVKYDSLYLNLGDTVYANDFSFVYSAKNTIMYLETGKIQRVYDVEYYCDNNKTWYGCDSSNCHMLFFNKVCDVVVNCNDSIMGYVSGTGCYSVGDSVIIIATPKPNHHFVSWSNGDTDSVIGFIVTTDTVFTAYFAENSSESKITVIGNVNNNNMGYVTGSGLYDYGDVVTLKAIANNHYHFVNWSNGETSDVLTFIAQNDMVLTAIFQSTQYYLVANANYANRGVVTGSGIYSYLDNAAITATPNEGYQFTGWSNGETNPVSFVTVESDTVITAIFVPEGQSGVNDVTDEFDVSLTPNPVRPGMVAHVYGEFGEVETVEILNNSGQVIDRFAPSSYPIEIDGLEVDGLYYVRIITRSGEIYTEKLLVK